MSEIKMPQQCVYSTRMFLLTDTYVAISTRTYLMQASSTLLPIDMMQCASLLQVS